MLPLVCRIADAAEAAGISRSTIYDEIRQGRLRAIKIGRATRIRFCDLETWLGSRPVIKPQGVLSSTETGGPTSITSKAGVTSKEVTMATKKETGGCLLHAAGGTKDLYNVENIIPAQSAQEPL